MQDIIRKSVLRTIKIADLPATFKSYQGTPLKTISKQQIPKGFQVVSADGKHHLKAEYQFSDFKEAFLFFNILATTFSRFHYYPSMFNVYNKIIVNLGQKEITTKDVFLAHLISETIDKPVGSTERAHKRFSQI